MGCTHPFEIDVIARSELADLSPSGQPANEQGSLTFEPFRFGDATGRDAEARQNLDVSYRCITRTSSAAQMAGDGLPSALCGLIVLLSSFQSERISLPRLRGRNRVLCSNSSASFSLKLLIKTFGVGLRVRCFTIVGDNGQRLITQ